MYALVVTNNPKKWSAIDFSCQAIEKLFSIFNYEPYPDNQVPRFCYAVAACTAGFASWNRTDTSFETPGSCIVTPYITGATLIVFLLCVTMMNCVLALISFTSSVKRPT